MGVYKGNIIWGNFFILLLVNAVEYRSGLLITIFQVLFGMLAFGPQFFRNKNFYLNKRITHIFEFLFICSLLLGISRSWYSAPNHIYLFTVISLLLIVFKKNKDFVYLKDNFRWVLVLVLGFATLHKVVSPNFWSGDFIGYSILRGGFLRPLLVMGFFPQLNDIFLLNASYVNELANTDPILSTRRILETKGVHFEFLIEQFTFFILGIELILTLFLIFMPKTKLTLYLFLIFVASIGLIVSEFEFGSTLLFMGYIVCPNDKVFLKKAYQIIFLIYASAAVIYNVFWI